MSKLTYLETWVQISGDLVSWAKVGGFVVIGTDSGAIEADSSPRDSFNISAPKRCRAVIVEGVGSGILIKENFHNLISVSCHSFGIPILITSILAATVRDHSFLMLTIQCQLKQPNVRGLVLMVNYF